MAEETIPQMRERIESLEKDLRASQKTNETLSTENRTLQAREVFRQQGYDPNQAKLFVNSNPEADITPESVAAFATEYNLSPVATQTEETSSTEETGSTETSAEGGDTSASGANLGSMSRAGSGAGGGGQQPPQGKRLTKDEWRELKKTDPVAARAAVQQNRVELRKDNPFAAQQN